MCSTPYFLCTFLPPVRTINNRPYEFYRTLYAFLIMHLTDGAGKLTEQTEIPISSTACAMMEPANERQEE